MIGIVGGIGPYAGLDLARNVNEIIIVSDPLFVPFIDSSKFQ